MGLYSQTVAASDRASLARSGARIPSQKGRASLTSAVVIHASACLVAFLAIGAGARQAESDVETVSPTLNSTLDESDLLFAGDMGVADHQMTVGNANAKASVPVLKHGTSRAVIAPVSIVK